MANGGKFYLYNVDSGRIEEYKDKDVIDDLYYLKAKIPTKKDISNTQNKEAVKYFEEHTISQMKTLISKLEYKIPLYDIYSKNLYIIDKVNVYSRVINNYYRFPERTFMDYLKRKIALFKKELEEKIDILKERRLRKLRYMQEFLGYFDMNELFNTYTRVFYLYANEVGKDIIGCKRSSFLPHFSHLKPYYSRKEVINLALNMGIKLDKNTYYDHKKIYKLCTLVKENDISSKILLKHQEYMIRQNKVGLVQYYSLHGSYIINKYLRSDNNYKDEYLENMIQSMWSLVDNAPAFNKEYIVYRFVNDDGYMKHLNIGDIFYDNGFTSTTRDPFYKPDEFKFGFILVKIKLPHNQIGAGLCIETLSHFPKEQEIILAPKAILRLDKKNDDYEYYNSDTEYISKIKTKYEFTYIGKGDIKIDSKPAYEKGINTIDFLKISETESLNINDKIDFFLKTHIYPSPENQFKVKIGDESFTLMANFFDSTGAYKKFYGIRTMRGMSLYSIYKNYILFFIEIGATHNSITTPDDNLNPGSIINIMHVDYAISYTTIDRKNVIADNDFILFLSSIAKYFGIDKVIVHADYISCDIADIKPLSTAISTMTHDATITTITTNKEKKLEIAQEDHDIKESSNTYFGGKHCIDFYNYMKDGYKKYIDDRQTKILTTEIIPKFSYYYLDKLKSMSPLTVLKKSDLDELYVVYKKVFLSEVGEDKDNIKDFYLWVIEKKSYLIQTLTEKFNRIFKQNNPFEYSYYILYPLVYLYNRKYIPSIEYTTNDNNTDIRIKRNINSFQITSLDKESRQEPRKHHRYFNDIYNV